MFKNKFKIEKFVIIKDFDSILFFKENLIIKIFLITTYKEDAVDTDFLHLFL